MSAIPSTTTSFTQADATAINHSSFCPATSVNPPNMTVKTSSMTATLNANVTNDSRPNSTDTYRELQSTATNSYTISTQKDTFTNNITTTTTCNTTEEKPRKRTRATPEQLAVLEKTFTVNPSPNHRIREQLSHELGMSERSIQIWFQNRRAKVKNAIKRSTMLQDKTLRIQYYASQAATAACQAAIYNEQQRNDSAGTSAPLTAVEDPIRTHPDLYYYYYYYYFNQQQQQQLLRQRPNRNHYNNNYAYHPYAHHNQKHNYHSQQQPYSYIHEKKAMVAPSLSPLITAPPPPIVPLETMPPPPPPPPMPLEERAGSISPSDTSKSAPHQPFLWSSSSTLQPLPSVQSQVLPTQRARAHTVGPYFFNNDIHHKLMYDRGSSVDPSQMTFRQQQQQPTLHNIQVNTANETAVASPNIDALYTPTEQPPENFRDLLLTQELSSSSPTSPSSIALVQQQQQFAKLSVHDHSNAKELDSFLNYFGQQLQHQPQPPEQLNCWPNLPFYNGESANVMMTPTTPPCTSTEFKTDYDNKLAMTMSAFTYTTDTTKTTTTTIEKKHPSFSVETLQIGTWKRMTFQPGDLLCQYDSRTKVFSWCIQDGSCRFKLEFSENVVESVSIEPLSHRAGWAQLKFKLASLDSISFYMERTAAADVQEEVNSFLHQNTATVRANTEWVQCRDYTEGKQASSVKVHQLDGPTLALKSELALLAKESEYIASLLKK